MLDFFSQAADAEPVDAADSEWPSAAGWISISSGERGGWLRSSRRRWFVLGDPDSATTAFPPYVLRWYDDEAAAARAPGQPRGALSLHWQHVDVYADEGAQLELVTAQLAPGRFVLGGFAGGARELGEWWMKIAAAESLTRSRALAGDLARCVVADPDDAPGVVESFVSAIGLGTMCGGPALLGGGGGGGTSGSASSLVSGGFECDDNLFDDDDARAAPSARAAVSSADDEAAPAAVISARTGHARAGAARERVFSDELLGVDPGTGEAIVRDARTGRLSVRQRTFWARVQASYTSVLKAIIRPPRARYDEATALGPATFEWTRLAPGAGRGRGARARATRTDFYVANRRRLRVRCSHWVPDDLGGGAAAGATWASALGALGGDGGGAGDAALADVPCVVYCHGNSSCRVEALNALRVAFEAGATLCALDCAGSGVSDGEYVSLGHFEQYDVQAVCEHLRAHRRAGRIALWGRSMGAVACLLDASRNDPLLAAVVSDSAFASLPELAGELVAKAAGTSAASVLFDTALSHVSASVQYRAGFTLDACCPRASLAACCAPVLLLHGADDAFIGPDHARRLEAACGAACERELRVFDGGTHASTRPAEVLALAAVWLRRHLHGAAAVSALAMAGEDHLRDALLGAARARPGVLSRPPWIADAPPGAAQGADEDLSTSAGRRQQASTVDDEEHTDFRRIANSGRSFSQRDAMVAKLRQLSDQLDDDDGF